MSSGAHSGQTIDASQAGSSNKSAWRRHYSTLHPSLQLIGLQLWMPLFFIVAFCLCYVAAFHAPHPHEVPVALVGVSERVTTDLSASLGDAVTLEAYDTVEAAKAAVLNGDVAIAFDSATNVIYKATAHQFQVASLLPPMITPTLVAAGITPTTTDLSPLPSYDEYGTVSLYLMLAWCIGGYMVAMFIGLMGAPLKHGPRIAVIVAGGAIISAITNLLAGPIIGAVHGHFLPMFFIAWGWIVAIGLATNGFSYFAGRFIAMPAMVVFIFLSMPSSGAAYPAWFMPQPFAWLNNVVVGSGITEMLKRELYGVGPGYERGLIMMITYAVVGVVLMIVGRRLWERRRVRQIVSGKTTMFQDANAANRDFLAAQREEVLVRHGLSSTDTGTINTIPREELDGYDAQPPDRRDFDDTADMFLGSNGGLESPTLPQRKVAEASARRSHPDPAETTRETE